ncbi:MAG: GtrA family protein [Oscillospiraceae bacterium]|nr:GtrA family protein [Oscillospiraceae bacterium]
MNKLKQFLTGEFIRQLFSYVCVGGTAAIAEWVMFFIFVKMGFDYKPATALAFVVSTAVNYVMGRLLTFKGNNKYEGKKLREIALIYLVSIIGLGFNLLLMWLFVDILGFTSDIMQLAAKIMSTGIVFFWNFFIRKLAIYRQK